MPLLLKTCPGLLKHHKAAKQAFNVGPSSAYQRITDDGPLLVLFVSSVPSSMKTKKNVVRLVPPLAHLSRSAHG